jgi:hypothetical protein
MQSHERPRKGCPERLTEDTPRTQGREIHGNADRVDFQSESLSENHREACGTAVA